MLEFIIAVLNKKPKLDPKLSLTKGIAEHQNKNFHAKLSRKRSGYLLFCIQLRQTFTIFYRINEIDA